MMTATMNCIFGLTVILLSHAFPDFSQDLAPDKVNCSLPNTLYVEVTSANQSLVLRLEKNPDVDPNAAIFLLNREAVLLKHRLQYSHNRAEYQDREHMATVEVTCTDNEDGNSTLSLRGLISMPDRRLYTLEPSRRFSRDETRTNEDLHNVIDRFWLDYAVLDHITDIPPANPPCPQPDAATPGAAPDVLLDIVVFVDHTVYQRWYNKSKRSTPEKKRLDTIENIRRHFGHLMNAVDLRFKMASPRFHAHLAGFVIETAGPGDRSREVPDPQTRTEVEGRWLLDSAWTLVSRTPGFPPNDHVIVFTESALFTTQEGIYTDVLGISYNGRMCHPYGYSISVTRYQDRLVDDVIAAAHEIGHSLGAQHDGISNSCSASENYIMSGTHAAEAHVTQNNQYIFSECSVRSFQKHVALLEARGDGKTLSCLYETIHPGPASFLLPAPGQTHDVHRQCQMIYSPSSFFCHIDIGGSENVCRRMPCYNPRTRRCSHHRARDGTTCGNRKWCVAGSCVLSTDAPAKQADCVFGNRPGPVYQGQDCGQTLGSKRYLCYSQRNRQVCCDTCLKMATGPPGCEYGNNYWNISSCSPEHCGEPGSQYSRLCCDTCQTAPATPGLQTSSSTTYTPFVKGTGGTQSTSSNKTTVDENTPSVRPTSPANVTEGSAQETSSFITGMYDAAVTASSSAVYSTTAEGSSTEPKFNISGIKTILSKSNVVETTSMVTKRTYESLIEARVKTSEHALTTEPSKTSITESAAEEASTPFLPAATTASSATSVTTNEPPKSTSKRFLNDSPADVLSVDNTGERGQAQVDMSLFGACASGEGLHGSTDLSCTAETTQTPTKCYDIAYYNRCCTACRVFHSNVTGCEFGDRDPSMCRTIDRLSCCDHRTHCCATCHEDTQPLMCGYGTGSRSPRHALLVVVLSLCILT